ncbi:hypothetical protein F4802DRAFT_593576 [Xylaria palmicola]|nr:hypothetical protein F4802DRAFT_593576 [Xylaria palmicola]
MSKLPLKVQVAIRDSWDSKDAPVQKAIGSLSELGVDVTVNPEWPLLLAELGSFHPDKGTLVPSVAAVVAAYCATLRDFADDPENENWADTLLNQTGGRIRIVLEVSKSREIGLTWSEQQKGFLISLPKSAPPSESYVLSFFAGSLPSIFDKGSAAAHRTQESTAAATPADDWADVEVDDKTGNAAVVELPQRHAVAPAAQQQSPLFDVIPEVGVIARPDELLKRPPYHLILHKYSSARIDVQCSHSPTLQFLSDYLKKWARTNHNNTTRPPYAEVILHQSAFGLGVMYDRLTIDSDVPRSVQDVSPTILLALIEGVLGYKNVYNGGSLWTFRRDIEFKSSRY